jgi:hypothetical protein
VQKYFGTSAKYPKVTNYKFLSTILLIMAVETGAKVLPLVQLEELLGEALLDFTSMGDL